MKASELRIGNLVDVIEFKNVEVLGVSMNNIGLKVDSSTFLSVDINEINPIPLTEEWLLKLGFKYKKWDDHFIIKNGNYFNSIKKYDDGWHYNTDESDATCYYLTTIQYVHQLQNLYFALTGEELEIKDNDYYR